MDSRTKETTPVDPSSSNQQQQLPNENNMKIPKEKIQASNEEEDEDDLEEEKKKREEERKLRKEKAKKRKEEIKKRVEEQQQHPFIGSKKNTASKFEPSTSLDSSLPETKIREDLVATCVNFLNHPKVKASPLQQKITFMQKKGLTQEEIQEAMRRAERTASSSISVPVSSTTGSSASVSPYLSPPSNTTPVIASSSSPTTIPYTYYGQPTSMFPQQPPIPYYGPVPTSSTKQDSKYSMVGFTAMAFTFVGIGVGISYLAKRYLMPFLNSNADGSPTLEKEKPKSNRLGNGENIEKIANTLQALQEQNQEIKDTLRLVSDQQKQVVSGNRSSTSYPRGVTTFPSSSIGTPSFPDKDARILELEAEVKALRAARLDSRSFGLSNLPDAGNSDISYVNSFPFSGSGNSPSRSYPPTQRATIPSWQQQQQQQSQPSISSSQSISSASVVSQSQSTISSLSRKISSENSIPISTSTSEVNGHVKEPHGEKFEKVMELLQNGQTPDDINPNIDDKPADPTIKIEKGTKETPPKPWEKVIRGDSISNISVEQEVDEPEPTLNNNDVPNQNHPINDK